MVKGLTATNMMEYKLGLCWLHSTTVTLPQGPVVVKGLDRYLELKQLAERQKREAEERAAQVGTAFAGMHLARRRAACGLDVVG